jgi:restriction system protein
MRLLDAVEQILAEAKAPLHYTEIAQRALESGVWRSRVLRPQIKLQSALIADIRKHGKASRFQHAGPERFALRRWGFPEVRNMTLPAPERKRRAPGRKRVLSYTDATERVLERAGEKRPMHYRQIAAEALRQGWVETEAASPEATLYARVRTENRRRLRLGDSPRFIFYGRGLIGLSKWMGSTLSLQIEWHNREMRKQLHRRLRGMDPYAFESLVGELLVALGFENVVVTARSADGGIDVRGTLVVGDVIRTNMAVQAKRWKQNVQAPVVQQVRGSLGTHDQGLIITTSDFTRGAREEAQRPNAIPVALMDGEQLVKLLIEHDLGVRRLQQYLIELPE